MSESAVWVWHLSHRYDAATDEHVSEVYLLEEPSLVHAVSSVVEFFESSILRHWWFRGTACNSKWYTEFGKWEDSKQREIIRVRLSPDQLEAIDTARFGPEDAEEN